MDTFVSLDTQQLLTIIIVLASLVVALFLLLVVLAAGFFCKYGDPSIFKTAGRKLGGMKVPKKFWVTPRFEMARRRRPAAATPAADGTAATTATTAAAATVDVAKDAKVILAEGQDCGFVV